MCYLTIYIHTCAHSIVDLPIHSCNSANIFCTNRPMLPPAGSKPIVESNNICCFCDPVLPGRKIAEWGEPEGDGYRGFEFRGTNPKHITMQKMAKNWKWAFGTFTMEQAVIGFETSGGRVVGDGVAARAKEDLRTWMLKYREPTSNLDFDPMERIHGWETKARREGGDSAAWVPLSPSVWESLLSVRQREEEGGEFGVENLTLPPILGL